jgi:membrane protein DedA with SNARE-associated domain
MLETLVNGLTEIIFKLGYLGITLLMALESSFVPFPSEVVLPPAGYLAAQGRMNAPLALAAGLTGSLIGALVNYYLAAKLGSPLLHRYGRYFLMKEKSLDRAEDFFRRHGEISTFIGRLIPVIRQLISLPAGFARMRVGLFVFYTALGAGIWCTILTYIGWYVGRNAEMLASFDELIRDPQVHRYSSRAGMAMIPLVLLVVAVYVWFQRRKAKGARQHEATGAGGGQEGTSA